MECVVGVHKLLEIPPSSEPLDDSIEKRFSKHFEHSHHKERTQHAFAG